MMNTQELELIGAEKKYLDETMNGVSRSFAVVVLSLEEPLNNTMATAYLICRVVDNIEDCAQAFAWKEQRFREFHRLVEEPDSASQILAVWSQEAWPGLTQDESDMMGQVNGSILWEIYARIPDESRATIRRWASEMADGMLRVEDPAQRPLLEKRGDVRVLAAESDYNEYCFYVAGTVGHMATELVVAHYELAEDVASRLLATSAVASPICRTPGTGKPITPRCRWPARRWGGRRKSSTMSFESCMMPPSMSWRCPTTQPAIGWPVS
jgi:phytoene/squalene synthetase